MNIKDRRTKVLLTLYLLAGTDHAGGTHQFTPVSISIQAQKAFELPMNRKTINVLNQLAREGLIVKSGEGSDVEYQLKKEGFLELSLRFPYVRFLVEKWDETWRILSYEIPEKKRDLRDRLRREVAGWGLGPWHRSFWVTPHPIIDQLKSLLNGKAEAEYVQAFEAKHMVGEVEVLIEKVWGKSKLQAEYKALFKAWHEILSRDEEKEVKFQKIVSSYVEVLRKDPGLPPELVGKEWIGFEAYTIFREIRSILLS